MEVGVGTGTSPVSWCHDHSTDGTLVETAKHEQSGVNTKSKAPVDGGYPDAMQTALKTNLLMPLDLDHS